MVRITIDGVQLDVEEGKTILEVALKNNIYIPNLCYHPNVSPAPGKIADEIVYRNGERYQGVEGEYEGCGLCFVIADGEIVKACDTPVRDGLKVDTRDERAIKERKSNLVRIFATHPHVCITCEYRNGCDRIQCTFGYPVEERCCDLFSKCELRFTAEYIGIPPETPRYMYRGLPVVEEKLYKWDWNYCINCTRCVRGCREVREANALGFVIESSAGNVIVGRTAQTDVESGCKFCGVCVEICPTGVVRDIKKKASNKWRDSIVAKKLPLLTEALELTPESVASLPDSPGVFRLYDENMEVVYIKGTPNLREELHSEVGRAAYFDYEEHEMYTMRESELIQEFLQKHGRMPKLNDEVDDLFDL